MNGYNGVCNMIMLQRNLFYNDGLQFIKEKEYEKAENKFSLITLKMTDIQALFQVARCQQLQGNYFSALLTYEHVFQKNPSDPRPIYQSGYIYIQLQNDEKALQCFEKAVSIMESSSQVEQKFGIIYYALGLQYFNKGRIQEAQTAFQNCANLKYCPDSVRAVNKLQEIEELEIDNDLQTCQYKLNINPQPRLTGEFGVITQENTSSQKEEDFDKKDSKKISSNMSSSQNSTSDKHQSINTQRTIQTPIPQKEENSSSLKKPILLIQHPSLDFKIFLNKPPLSNHSTASASAAQTPQTDSRFIQANPQPSLRTFSFSDQEDTLEEEVKQQNFQECKTERILIEKSGDNQYSDNQHPYQQQPQNQELEDSFLYFEEEIPDEKEGQMMLNRKNFRNIHLVKQFQQRSICDLLQNKPSQLSSGISHLSHVSHISFSSHSRYSTANDQGSQISNNKREFDHPEKSLSAYIQKKQLGEGAFGRVFEVTYKTDGNSFAMKIIPNSSIMRQHLTSGEIDIMKQLSHKNIIKIYNAFKSDDQQSYCIISELADNGTLKEYIQKTKGKVDKFEVLNMMKQMITALNYIHSQRIIHRDIKPGNIFLNGNSKQIKIGDFGIAKKLANKEVQQALHSLGTEKYFSPEYTKEGFSVASDIWSMGIVFLELLGVSVIEGMQEDKKRNYFKQIPPELSDIISGMTQHDSAFRSTSAAVLAQLKNIK